MASRENGPNSMARQLPPTLEMLARGKGATGWGQCANGATGTCFGGGSGGPKNELKLNFQFKVQINFLPSLTALDTLFLRQHNSVASKLMVGTNFGHSIPSIFQSINREWSDEQLFQEARRIVIAQFQLVTFEEWLPLVIGREQWHRARLDPMAGSRGEGETPEDDYSLGEDPSTVEFI